MKAHRVINDPSLEGIISAEKWGQEYARKIINKIV